MFRGASAGLRWSTSLLAVLVLALILSAVYARIRWQPPPTHGPSDRVIRVQVLNGSGESGVGSKVAAYLREGAFHVVDIDNADAFDYFTTLVVARTEDPTPAHIVARYLGNPPVILQAWDRDFAEVTVIVGSDRSQLSLE